LPALKADALRQLARFAPARKAIDARVQDKAACGQGIACNG